MNPPWKTWFVFGACAAVLLAVMAWGSGLALRLDRAQAEARGQADLEEKARLALWRMDSMLTPLIAQESARPYFAYHAFYPAERAYGKMFNTLAPGEVLVPSPLLTQVSSNILLHFQLDPTGRLTSPQVPQGNQRDLAEAQFVTHERIEANAARLSEFDQILAQAASPELARRIDRPLRASSSRSNDVNESSATRLPSLAATQPSEAQPAVPAPRLSNREILLRVAPAPQSDRNLVFESAALVVNPLLEERLLSARGGSSRAGTVRTQTARNADELQARAQSVQQAFDLSVQNTLPGLTGRERTHVVEGLFKPVWFDQTLVLVRRVAVQGEEYVQGCWLDWPSLRRWLLEGVRDLLPHARLDPLEGSGDAPTARMLAALPIRLATGPANGIDPALGSPIRFALILAWLCVLVAGVAVALLLRGTLSMSDRRAAFVSAVTHELRTPLTTFKMYSEMLANGMVADETKRQNYLTTLCAEANRLQHLVENVLAYARLERGNARRRVEKVAVRELLDRVRPRLVARVEQAGMRLQEQVDALSPETAVSVDVAVVEQILFNLVDNACKYAAPSASDRTLHLEAALANAGFVQLRVRDHGPGISSTRSARRLFEPFNKSAHEAASTAPGVGLGLALCRRLSRSLGGDVRLDPSVRDGACFELLLPRA